MTDSRSVQYVDWVEMQYTDVAGRLRSISIPYSSGVLQAKVDSSSIGIDDVSESDAVLIADESTLTYIPWLSGWSRTICDIYKSSSARHSVDPRFITQRLEAYMRELGMEILLGIEVEFFVFEKLNTLFSPPTSAGYRIKLVDRGGKGTLSNYHSSSDKLLEYRVELVDTLTKYFNISVVSHHHEVASSQLELSIGAGRPTNTGDRVQTVKYVAKALARSRGLKAVFMPKPLHGENGSGMHVHVSLWSNSKNLFYDSSDSYGLSQFARYFIGGLIYHARALTALVAPTVNSYRRFIPGFEAPVYAVWGYRNRSAAIRVPVARGELDTRVEFRPPDPSANPYLALAAIAMAGLDGIRKSIDPGDPIDRSAYEMSATLRKRKLPSSLVEALDELSLDREFLKPVFTDELLEKYVSAKTREVLEAAATPSPIEVLIYQDI
ncbi:MAG: type I glutamate--ammonia ligase [Sulfolobales archaeon]|nr:type I glutamate--ammonia ligase [Sulfolobales archaeon]MDW8082525.1 type I glutamate--ammonia ligase [Sulfolobales archaeon]